MEDTSVNFPFIFNFFFSSLTIMDSSQPKGVSASFSIVKFSLTNRIIFVTSKIFSGITLKCKRLTNKLLSCDVS